MRTKDIYNKVASGSSFFPLRVVPALEAGTDIVFKIFPGHS